MANPKFRSGPITFKAGETLSQFRFVTIDGEGRVSHAGVSDVPRGVVTESAAPEGDRSVNDLSLGLPENVAVHIGGVVGVETSDEFATGSVVYVASDGLAASSGDVAVGWAAGPDSDGRVPVVLQLPVQAAPAQPDQE